MQADGGASPQVMAAPLTSNISELLSPSWPPLSWPHAPLLPNWVRGDRVAGLRSFRSPLGDVKVS